MKRTTNNLFLYSLTSLAVMGASAAYAEQFATAPTLEGGVTATIGAWYGVASADGQDYGSLQTVDGDGNIDTQNVAEVSPDFDWGLNAELGYIFEDTANGVELSFRMLNTDDSDNTSSNLDTPYLIPQESSDAIYVPVASAYFADASSTLSYEFNSIDLMFLQFLDVGRHVQMRFSAGASYLDLEKEQTSLYNGSFIHSNMQVCDFEDGETCEYTDATAVRSSDYTGVGPRVAVDGRYDFGNGFGVLGGGSVAYYVGDLDFKDSCSAVINSVTFGNGEIVDSSASAQDCGEVTDDIDNHGVTNLRANVAIDYVYFMENETSTLGLELGYQFDYYADAIQEISYDYQTPELSETHSISFSGPYLNLKGAF